MSLQLLTERPLFGVPEDPVAAKVREEKQEQQRDEEEEEVEDEDMEEKERVDALLQRKKLLQDLGVVDQIHQLLQGRTEGGGVLQDASDTFPHQQSKQVHQRQQTKVSQVLWSPSVCHYKHNNNCASSFSHFTAFYISDDLFDAVFPKDQAAAALHSALTAGT